jgi:hypothetical protein
MEVSVNKQVIIALEVGIPKKLVCFLAWGFHKYYHLLLGTCSIFFKGGKSFTAKY